MSEAQKKIIAIMGATGAQGGGLIEAILAEKNSLFVPRGITHDLNSPKAKALIARGVEMVQGDVDNQQSLEKAFAGAYGIFCVTFFWAHFSGEKEEMEAANLARAAKIVDAQHVIWSTLEDTRKWIPLSDKRMPTLQEKYKNPAMDAKGVSNLLFTLSGVPVTFLYTSFYWDNAYNFNMGPAKGPDGTYSITFPMGDERLAGIATDDIGKCALGIFKGGQRYINKSISISGENLTCWEMAEKYSKGLGINCTYNEVTPNTFRGFNFPGAIDLGNMFQFFRDCSAYLINERNIEATKALNPELKNFDQWLAVNKDKIKL